MSSSLHEVHLFVRYKDVPDTWTEPEPASYKDRVSVWRLSEESGHYNISDVSVLDEHVADANSCRLHS